MVPVTEEEKKLSYYKYFIRDMAPIPEDKIAIWKGPAADSSLAQPIEERDRFLDLEPWPLENGFCIAPDGTGFVANTTFMPGLTPEMYQWWAAWHCIGSDLRYKIWDRDDHLQARAREVDHICDPNIPLGEKSWGVSHDIIEDVGFGMNPLVIHFKKPSDLGFSDEKLGTPGCLAFNCGIGEGDAPALVANKVVQAEGGLLLRYRFWIGFGLDADGNLVKVVPDGESVPEFVPRALFGHNIKEIANMAAFLPELFAEEGHKPLVAGD